MPHKKRLLSNYHFLLCNTNPTASPAAETAKLTARFATSVCLPGMRGNRSRDGAAYSTSGFPATGLSPKGQHIIWST